MKMKGMTIVLAVILCAATVQGFPMFREGRCFCMGPGVKAVKVADIKSVSIFNPNNSCDKLELIITLKKHKGKRCLNPTSKQARAIIQRAREIQSGKTLKSWK